MKDINVIICVSERKVAQSAQHFYRGRATLRHEWECKTALTLCLTE